MRLTASEQTQLVSPHSSSHRPLQQHFTGNSPPVYGWSIAISVSIPVSLSVCQCVCPLACLKNYMYKFHKIFRKYYMWPWSVLLWRQCNTTWTYGFVDDVIYSHNGVSGPQSRTTLCFVEFARWRHRGEVVVYDCSLFLMLPSTFTCDLSCEFDLDNIRLNQRTKYLDQR